MEDDNSTGMGRRAFMRASALGAAAVAVPLGSEATAAEAAIAPPVGSLLQPKYATAPVDMSKTYVNPINLPWIEVRRTPSAMPATDAGVAVTTGMLPILAKPTWVEADGRNLLRQAKTGFTLVSENAFRSMADFSAVNYDGTIWLYCSGNIQTNGNQTLYSTTDYVHWNVYQMNVGPTAPSAVRVKGKYYLVGNGSPVYVSDAPQGPWTELGRFTRPSGATMSPSDVQFFLDDNGRLYISFNIGAPIQAAELDPNNPSRMLTEPVNVVDFDPYQEWMHFADNKAAY